MQHFDAGTAHAWLDGALPADEQLLIERHVRECAECAALVAEARGLIAGASRIVSALDVVPGGVIPANRPAAAVRRPASVWRSLHLTPLRAGLAATLMIAVASLFAARRNSANKPAMAGLDQHVERVVAGAPTPPAIAPANSPAAGANRVTAEVAAPPRRQQPAPVSPKPASSKPAEQVAAAPAASIAPTTAKATDSVSTKANAAAADRLSALVVTGGAANASGEMRRAVIDSAGAARFRDTSMFGRSEMSVPGTRRAFARDAALPSPPPLVAAVVNAKSGAAAPTLLGCYRLVPDSLSPVSAIPERFALDQSGSALAIRNVVRAVRISGEMDSVLTGADWRALTDGSVVVSWTVGGVRESARLVDYSTGLAAAESSIGRIRALRVARLVCSR
jgi:Putative zinc-finger